MSKFSVKVFVTLKPSILDPQGRTVERALAHQGHDNVSKVRMGKYITLELEGERDAVEAQVATIAKEILSNPIMENVSWDIEEATQ